MITGFAYNSSFPALSIFTPALPCQSLCSSIPTPAVVFITPPRITTTVQTNPKYLIDLTTACVEGNITAIQLRDPFCENLRHFVQAETIIRRTITKLTPANPSPILLINGGPEPTHFPERSIERLRDKRRVVGETEILGCSVHSVQSAQRAIEAGASYLQVGTMFFTKSHPGKIPEGLQLMTEVRSRVGDDVVLIGIGGITRRNAGEVMKAGASGVAVISAISEAEDPQSIIVELCRVVRMSNCL